MHTSEQLLALSRAEKDARKKLRLLAMSHFVECNNRPTVARMLKVSRRSVNEWVHRYLTEGLRGLDTKKSTGRPSSLTAEQEKQLKNYIIQRSQSDKGGRLTGENICTYIHNEFGVQYHHNAIYKLLPRLGFSWITSRSKHPKQSQETQDEFKKTGD